MVCTSKLSLFVLTDGSLYACKISPHTYSCSDRMYPQTIFMLLSLYIFITGDVCGFPTPCHNDGTCIPNGEDFLCICLPNYAGTTCEIFNGMSLYLIENYHLRYQQKKNYRNCTSFKSVNLFIFLQIFMA